MQPRVRTTSVSAWEKSTEVISLFFMSAPNAVGSSLVAQISLFPSSRSPPFPPLPIYFVFLPTLPFVLFARTSLISLLQVRGFRPTGKPASNEKGD